MLKTITLSVAMLAISGAAAMACTPEDVQARQGPLVAAVQNLLATDPAKAQAIVIKMQADLDQAAADGDEAATCVIMDEALATAQN